MALRDATAIKAISDANPLAAKTTLDGDVGDTIDAALVAAATLGQEKVSVDLFADINGKVDPIEIIQSGGNLMLDDVLFTLREKDFRVEYQDKKATSDGGQDRVTFTIAWNT